MPQDTALSTIFKAVGTGLGAASQQNQVDKKTQKQDALKMFMLMQEQEQMKMAQAKHNQAMLAGALNMKKADQDIKKNNIELNYLANPDLKFQEDLKKQNELKKQFILENLDPNLQGLDILKGVGINSSDDINISPLDMGTLGLDTLNRVKDSLPAGSTLETPFGSAVGKKQKSESSPTNYEFLVDTYGQEFLKDYLTLDKKTKESDASIRAGEKFKESQRQKEVISRANKWLSGKSAEFKKALGISTITKVSDLQKAVDASIAGTGESFLGVDGLNPDTFTKEDVNELSSFVSEYLQGTDTKQQVFSPITEEENKKGRETYEDWDDFGDDVKIKGLKEIGLR